MISKVHIFSSFDTYITRIRNKIKNYKARIIVYCAETQFIPRRIRILCEDTAYVLGTRDGTIVNPPVRVYLTISIISLHSRVTVEKGKPRIFQSLFQSFLSFCS